MSAFRKYKLHLSMNNIKNATGVATRVPYACKKSRKRWLKFFAIFLSTTKWL